jgi:hypothetical protein
VLKGRQDDINEISDASTICAKKFTANSRGKGKHNGWPEEAVALYNEMYCIIRKQRRDVSRKRLASFESSLLKEFSQKGGGSVAVGAKPPKQVFMNSILLLNRDLDSDGSGQEEFDDESIGDLEEQAHQMEQDDGGDVEQDGSEDKSAEYDCDDPDDGTVTGKTVWKS